MTGRVGPDGTGGAYITGGFVWRFESAVVAIILCLFWLFPFLLSALAPQRVPDHIVGVCVAVAGIFTFMALVLRVTLCKTIVSFLCDLLEAEKVG